MQQVGEHDLTFEGIQQAGANLLLQYAALDADEARRARQ